MELKNFIKEFAFQFDDTDPSEIKASTEFHELEEWSSMIGLSVLNMIEKKMGKHITFDDMKVAVTIEDLYNVCITK